MNRAVVIDCFPNSVQRYRNEYAVVTVDVIRATTVAVTAVAMGRKCFPVSSLEAARVLAAQLNNPLLAGELAGEMPKGFDMNNSPAELALRIDTSRPVILFSSTGTKLMCAAADCDAAYVACFRNYLSLATYLAGRHSKIAVIGAGSLGEFREEDQMCCAWIAEELSKSGYNPQNDQTVEIIKRWSGASPDAFVDNKSVDYLRRSGQLKDLDFILAHVNDLGDIFMIRHGQIVRIRTKE
ncbi:MAG: 2-phosphosulfolactate phosphatase [Candidatus Bathyarchaeia archaeon]